MMTTATLDFKTEQDFAAWLNWPATADTRNRWFAWDDDDFNGEFYDIAIGFEQAQDYEHINGLLAYFFTGPFAGEYWDGDMSMDGHLFTAMADSTKSARDDYGDVIDDLWQMLRYGTPRRKTDRAGAGTAGTRKFEGVQGKFWIVFK